MTSDGPCEGGHLTDAAMRALLDSIRKMTPEQYADLWDREQSRENIGETLTPATPLAAPMPCPFCFSTDTHLLVGHCGTWYCCACHREWEPSRQPPSAPLPCPHCGGRAGDVDNAGCWCIYHKPDCCYSGATVVTPRTLGGWNRRACPECAAWKQDCLIRAQNSQYWRARAEAAEARIAGAKVGLLNYCGGDMMGATKGLQLVYAQLEGRADG